jgi:hypothetical protein
LKLGLCRNPCSGISPETAIPELCGFALSSKALYRKHAFQQRKGPSLRLSASAADARGLSKACRIVSRRIACSDS